MQWIDFTKEQFQTALGRLDGSLRYLGVSPGPPPIEPPPPPPPPKTLSEVIFGNWRIDMQYQQVRYSLQLSFLGGYSFTGLLFVPPAMVPSMYSGTWRIDEPHEIALEGYWAGAMDLQQHPWNISFYIQAISETKLEGFNPPDRTQCLWRRM